MIHQATGKINKRWNGKLSVCELNSSIKKQTVKEKKKKNRGDHALHWGSIFQFMILNDKSKSLKEQYTYITDMDARKGMRSHIADGYLNCSNPFK